MKEYYQKVCLFLASFSVANLIIEFSFLVFLLSHFSLAGCLCIFEGWQVICFLPCWGGENLNCDKQRLSCLWHLKNRKWSSWSSMLNGRWGWCANAMQKKLAHHMLLPIIRVHTRMLLLAVTLSSKSTYLVYAGWSTDAVFLQNKT